MKYTPKYAVGAHLQYNSKGLAGATKGTVVSVNNDDLPHVYTLEPDLFKGQTDKHDVVAEQHIFGLC